MNRKITQHYKAQIIRDKFTKEASLDIDVEGEWVLYAGDSVESINRETPLLKGVGKGVFALNVSTQSRSYFELSTKGFLLNLAERLLPIRGGYNFRDLGGIPAKDGRTVKWGKLFRSDELTYLSDEDINYLNGIPLISVVDFRAPNETKRSPDRLPPSVKYTYPIAITPGNLSNEGIRANMLLTNINLHMKQMNRLLVTDPACIRAYKTLFTIIQHHLSAPIVFHCSAGKDRTGMAAALILFSLGVEEDLIMQDYMESKINLADKYAAFIAKYPKAEPIFTVKKMFLKAGINQINREYGSVDNFLRNTLKVDVWKMRRLYLEK